MTVVLVKELVLKNRLPVHEVAEMLGISFGSVQRILKDSVNMCQISAKFVLCLLTALSVHEFLAKKKMMVIPLPLCLLDLVSCDFFVFPKLKVAL
jgi:transcriptional regulator with XRE-family HTH domain